LGGDARFDSARKTLVDFNYFRAACADQMMVMAVVAVANKLESRRAIAEIKPLHHAHFLKQMHRAINRGQIAPVFWHGVKNFPVCQRMRMSPENFQNRLARTRDLARLPAQTTRQRGQFLPLAQVGMGASFHYPPKITPAAFQGKFAIKCKLFATNSRKTPITNAAAVEKLSHQQHLTRAFDGAGHAALIMRWQAGVFAGQDAALVGHELPEQVGVLEIQRVDGEIYFRFRTRRAIFRGAA
jgi:hypothetical protein